MNRSALVTFSLATAIAVMTLGYATPSYAEKPDCSVNDTHPSCKTDDSEGGASFVVTIEGSGLAGGSAAGNPWVQGVVGKNGIGLNDVGPDFLKVGTLTGLSMFPEFDTRAVCFPGDFMPVPTDPPAPHDLYDQLHQAIIKPGKKGRAEAKFWFHGKTSVGDVRVLYVLKLFGADGSADGFPPLPGEALDLGMTSWELKVENEGKTIKDISCLGAGDVVVTIEVTGLDTS